MLVNKLDTGEWLYVKNHDSVSLIQLFVFSTASFLLLGYIWNNIPIWDELETFGKDCLFSLLSIFIICLFFGISNSMHNVSWLTVFNYYLGKNSTSQFIFEKKVSAAKVEKKYITEVLDLIRSDLSKGSFDIDTFLKRFPDIKIGSRSKDQLKRLITEKIEPISPIIIIGSRFNQKEEKKFNDFLAALLYEIFELEYLMDKKRAKKDRVVTFNSFVSYFNDNFKIEDRNGNECPLNYGSLDRALDRLFINIAKKDH